MNFSINTKEFLKSLQFAARVLPSNKIAPVFECVLIYVRNDKVMVVTASDGNATLRIKSKCTELEMEEKEVSILAPADLLIRTLTALPNTSATFTYTVEGLMNFSLELAVESDLFTIPCEDPTAYFRVPEVKDGESLVLPAQKLQRGINQVVGFVSENAMRPELCGVSMRVFPGCLEFIATDGFTFSYYSRHHETDAKDKELIIPARFAKLLSDSIGDSEKNVTIDISGKMIKVHSGDWQAYSVLVEGVYPGKREHISGSFEYEATVNSGLLKACIKRANIFANFKEPEVSLDFKGNNLFISSGFEEKNTRSNQDIAVSSEIDSLSISFNSKRLLDALANVSGDFTICMNGTSKPAVIKPDAEDDEDIAIMVFPVVQLSI